MKQPLIIYKTTPFVNNYKTTHSLPAGPKPASVDNSGVAPPVFSGEILFIFFRMAGQKAREDNGRTTDTCKKTWNHGVTGLHQRNTMIHYLSHKNP